MSLINDALKRAKQAQENHPPPEGGPQFKPVEPLLKAERGLGLILPFVLALIALLGLFFVWQLRQRNAARSQQPIEAKAPATANPVSEPAPPGQKIAAATPQFTVPSAPAPKPMQQIPATTQSIAPPATVTVAVAPAPAFKLQAIFFIPGDSSAMLNGKTVGVGSVVSGFRVAGISQTSVTLVSGAHTNVLTLER